MGNSFDSNVKKALVTLAVEETLLKFGKPVYDLVSKKLLEDYHCYVPDCYEHPEYLKRILNELYGDASHKIVESIEKKLLEYAYQDQIKDFVRGIR